MGFQPENPFWPIYIYMDRRRKFLGALKWFMGRAAFTDADRCRFWPETIKSLYFYGFPAFFGSC
jgi:hypothetical protein